MCGVECVGVTVHGVCKSEPSKSTKRSTYTWKANTYGSGVRESVSSHRCTHTHTRTHHTHTHTHTHTSHTHTHT